MAGTDPSFIDEPIEASFDKQPVYSKLPGCPDAFVWRGESYQVIQLLREWRDTHRRGKMAHNMREGHLESAEGRGSWGVGRTHFRVQTVTGRVFDLYYDRAPKGSKERGGAWILLRELADAPTAVSSPGACNPTASRRIRIDEK